MIMLFAPFWSSRFVLIFIRRLSRCPNQTQQGLDSGAFDDVIGSDGRYPEREPLDGRVTVRLPG
jgi:hypothetical protein